MKQKYSTDYKLMRLNNAKQNLEGCCYAGLLILEIVDMLRYSSIIFSSKENDGSCYSDLKLLVCGILYEPDEIIPDAKITYIAENNIRAVSKYCIINNVSVPNNKVNILKLGDVAPLIIKYAQYNILSPKISADASIFLPTLKQHKTLWILKNSFIYSDDIKNMIKIINSLNEYFNNLSNEMQESKKFFNNLIYPYKKNHTISKDITFMDIYKKPLQFSIEKINLEKLDNLNNKAIIYHESPLLEFGYYLLNIDNKLDKHNILYISNVSYSVVVLNSNETIKHILAQYIKNLYMLKSLVETYPTSNDIKKISYVWEYYESNKF